MITSQTQRPPQSLARRRHRLERPAAAARTLPAAPRKDQGICVSATRLIEPMQEESTLSEAVQQLCLDECMQYFLQARVRSCQELPPEAISQIHPPERCWLVRLSVSQKAEAETADELEGIVSLWDGALHLLLC